MGANPSGNPQEPSKEFTQLSHLFAISSLSKNRFQSLVDILPQANPDEVRILSSVLIIPSARSHAGDILSGAHVTIFDFGHRYKYWKGLRSAHTRRSSHSSDAPQYHVDGPLSHTILFGKLGAWTWLLLEGHPQGLGHVIDWFKYSITHKNQGPYGSSSYTDNRPLRIFPVWKVVSQHQVFR
jgi:hypothetical protein